MKLTVLLEYGTNLKNINKNLNKTKRTENEHIIHLYNTFVKPMYSKD